MKTKLFFLYIPILILILLGIACSDGDDPQRPKHTYKGEPCDIVIELPSTCSWGEASLALATGNLSVSFTKPSWLSFSAPGGDIVLVASGSDSSGNSLPFKADFYVSTANDAAYFNKNLVSITPEFNRTVFIEATNFVAKLDPSKPIRLKTAFPMGTMLVSPTQENVFEPFTSTVTVYNGVQSCGQMTVHFTLQSLIDGYLSSAIEQIPDNAFDANGPQRREALLNKLQAAMQAFSTGNVLGARQKLENDLMAKCDGDDGGNGQNDWVADHFWKQSLYGALNKIDQVLMVVES